MDIGIKSLNCLKKRFDFSEVEEHCFGLQNVPQNLKSVTTTKIFGFLFKFFQRQLSQYVQNNTMHLNLER